ncbi:ABC transporter ATP-binding protein [Aquimarina sp. 2201CG1-2-11]|uniref:ATP-binding cassette domain-containing protein n=1 Tax=Aquimarina discodermiae TaxID=3231043 RepID=UPI0034619EAA
MFKQIRNIVSPKEYKNLVQYFIKSVVINFLDLISIAYLIPVLVLLMDKGKFDEMIGQMGVTSFVLTAQKIQLGIIVLILFYVIKNSIHIQFNKRFFGFLYNLSNTISIRAVNSFLTKDFLSYQKQNKGKMINVVTKVSSDFSCKLLHSIILLFSEITVLIVILGFLLYFYPKFTLTILVILSFFSLFIYFKRKSDFEIINTTYKKSQTAANSELLNILDGYLEIKSSKNESYFINNFKRENEKLNHVTAMLVSSSFNYSKHLETALIITLGLLTFLSLGDKGNNIIFLSTLAALGIRIIPSISKILNTITHIKSHFYTINLLKDFTVANIDTVTDSSTFSSIMFKNVGFSYSENEPILKDVNLQITLGEFLGVTGISGVGKTTLLYLTMGLIKPANGSIIIDNIPRESNSFSPFIGYVPQQPFLFSGTVLENIVMGQERSKIDHEYIDYLCEKLELSTLIDSLPNTYETVIEHNSLRFSGGQKQRLSLVRALYSRPKLLILDEATNQQNSALELTIFDFLKEMVKEEKMSVLSVSHNTALQGYYDKTFKLDNKKLIRID